MGTVSDTNKVEDYLMGTVSDTNKVGDYHMGIVSDSNKVEDYLMGAGGWEAWGPWGACSVTCGTGSIKRSRKCDSPAQMGGGTYCEGVTSEVTPCVLTPCAVDGMWGSWEQWGVCSATCESGLQLRNRTCDNPAPNHGGIDCQGRWRDSTICTLSTCPVHGGWESWKSWSACALVNRNVRRTRCRTCTKPTPAHGGDYCPHRPRQSENCDIPKSAVRRPCRCPLSRVAEIKNISAEELIVLVKEIKDELAVDVSKLSKTIGKKVSARDSRVSTKTIGVVGSVLLIIPFVLVIGLDCVNLYRYFRNEQDKVISLQ
ncbi:coadhesin-like [Mizuhopecten yessoensis]|uniref:coadhesin-like n=1 Tax=Mizuhopecten yessoensis TaxID=6573 RepID=UPI000B458330|nr:coadhesin-like [Mizuhopecten yessoensis]